uniref:3'(2'),5'-bisphosphate nucleotidase n=1 Tax=Aureoumbra lagunensis TaxID=44058 RepID=A0A7S3NJS9_9STRA
MIKYLIYFFISKVMCLRVPIHEMVSTCVTASEEGCKAIVAVHESGQWSTTLKEKENLRSALTEADCMSQKVMVNSLRNTFPGLSIVAEEEEQDEDITCQIELKRDLFHGDDEIGIDISRYTVVIDPLDGTREFVEGRLHNVRILLGIVIDGRAVAGVSAAPFLSQILAAEIKRWHLAPINTHTQVEAVLAAGDGKYKSVQAARDFFSKESKVEIGGTAAKFEAIISGQVGLAVTHAKTVAVDTCALEPMLECAGGQITDYFGAPLTPYTNTNRPNNLGVIASGKNYKKEHNDLSLYMRSHPAPLALVNGLDQNLGGDPCHALDIARTLDGSLLQLSHLENIFQQDITAFGVPEKAAQRGLMSQACRIVVRTKNNQIKSIFYKRVKFSDLSYQKNKSRLKIERDANSYLIEASFLNSDAVKSAGIPVPQVLGIPDLRRDYTNPLNSSFALFLSDFAPSNFWYQRNLLDFEHGAAGLKALAKFHAAFWGNTSIDNLQIWPHGAYFEPDKQEPDHFDKVGGDSWKRHYTAFADSFSQQKEHDFSTLGDRLQPLVRHLAYSVHPRNRENQQTIIHGDPKAANLFFRKSSQDADLQAGLIDFQWTGYGKVGADVAHFLAAAVEASTLYEYESSLLDIYYDALCSSNPNISASFSRLDLQADVEDDILDTGRLVFGYQWLRLQATPDILQQNANVLGRNAYNKNIQNAFWLVQRIDSLLLDRGL